MGGVPQCPPQQALNKPGFLPEVREFIKDTTPKTNTTLASTTTNLTIFVFSPSHH
jgi:hypothetical protein